MKLSGRNENERSNRNPRCTVTSFSLGDDSPSISVYFPLHVGNQWNYRNDADDRQEFQFGSLELASKQVDDGIEWYEASGLEFLDGSEISFQPDIGIVVRSKEYPNIKAAFIQLPVQESLSWIFAFPDEEDEGVN